MAKWRNKGAPFPGPDGKDVPRGGEFEADETDMVVRMRVHKLVRLPETKSRSTKKRAD